MSECFLGVDVGTSATKVILMDESGEVRGTASDDYAVSRLHAGWSEQDPEDWWRATVAATQGVVAKTGIKPASIGAVGFSGQMHGSVFLAADATADCAPAVRPAILWNDQRTQAECELIEQAAGGRREIIRAVGNRPLTGYTAPKILWVKRHEPAAFEQVASVLLPKDYVRFRLTGEQAIDAGDASGTLLLDPARRDWHDELLRSLGLDRSLLPNVVESAEVVGRIGSYGAEATGLLEGTPVVAGSGDQMTGAVGAGVVKPGLVSATLGTSGVVFAHLGSQFPRDHDGALQMMCAAVPGEYCTYGCMLSAAGALAWFRDTLAPDQTFAALDDLAGKVVPGAGGLVFLPYLTGERCPHPDPQARGAFIGLTVRHTMGHLVRAVMEGVACGMAQMLDLVRRCGVSPAEVRSLGGGAASSLWQSIQADFFDTPVSRLRSPEGSAHGAAILAAVGAGRWGSVAEACGACIQIRDHQAPGNVSRASEIRDAYEMLYPILGDAFERLAQLEMTSSL